jgi:ribosomal-protein-alanine N-acetyltransferase
MSERAGSAAGLAVRAMREQDLDEVLSIERAAYPHPWSRTIFADCLRVGYHCRVYCRDERILGYSVHSVVLDEAHLLNLCVRPESQSRGYGRLLLRNVMAEAREQGAETLFLEVRVSNHVAQALYHSEGFNEVGRRFDYYPLGQGREDALVYACQLQTAHMGRCNHA